MGILDVNALTDGIMKFGVNMNITASGRLTAFISVNQDISILRK